MKSTTIILALATVRSAFSNVIAERGSCNANNCLRGVRGTAKPDLGTRLADCSSFMQTTITPAPSTTTYTQTITTTLPVGMKRAAAGDGEGELEARAAGIVPTYATYCHNAAAYSSACSCIGITATTVTAPTQIVTAYAPDVTVDVCPNAGETNCGGTCFDLTESMNNCGACGNVCDPTYQFCNGVTCEAYVALFQCDNPGSCGANSCGGGCGFCYPDSFGQGYCLQTNVCGSSNACNSDADCLFSGICLTTCCGSVCAQENENLCYTVP